MDKKQVSIFLFLMFLILAAVPFVHAETQADTLKQYISDLQSNPTDNALREKIIKFVQTMKPAPVVPDEAERYMARGTAAVKSANDANDFKDAVREFEKAALAAPWLANVYYNLGIAQDKAGMYADAIKSLKLYLIAVPDASDAKKLIYEIEYRQEKAAKESSPEVIAEKKKNTEEEWLKKLDGARYVQVSRVNSIDYSNYVETTSMLMVQGNEIVYSSAITSSNKQDALSRIGIWKEMWRVPLYSRKFSYNGYGKDYICEFIISEDGNTIVKRCRILTEQHHVIFSIASGEKEFCSTSLAPASTSGRQASLVRGEFSGD